METCVCIAVVVVVGLSGERFPDKKACCLSSKTREKNVCRGRLIGLGTKLECRRLTLEILCYETGKWPEVRPEVRKSRACFARAQSFDRCEHENEKPAFSNSCRVKSVFEKLGLRHGLVWKSSITIEINLRFQFFPAQCGASDVWEMVYFLCWAAKLSII